MLKCTLGGGGIGLKYSNSWCVKIHMLENADAVCNIAHGRESYSVSMHWISFG